MRETSFRQRDDNSVTVPNDGKLTETEDGEEKREEKRNWVRGKYWNFDAGSSEPLNTKLNVKAGR